MLRERAGHFDISIPETRAERMRGLRGGAVDPGQALLLERCRSIHTFGMRGPIQVAWLDRSYRVFAVRRAEPRRLACNLRAHHVLECSAGADVRVGDVIRPRF